MTIRPATQEDLPWLAAAYLQELTWLDQQEFLFLPSEKNAFEMTRRVFAPAIDENRSAIFIVDDEGAEAEVGDSKIGALFWVIEATPFQLRYATATSYGQWVHPLYQGQGLVPRMIFHAAKFLREAGVGQVLDMAGTDVAIEAAKTAGFEVHEKVVVLKL